MPPDLAMGAVFKESGFLLRSNLHQMSFAPAAPQSRRMPACYLAPLLYGLWAAQALALFGLGASSFFSLVMCIP